MAAQDFTTQYQSGIFQFELFRLNNLLMALKPFGECIEQEELDDDALNDIFRDIAKTLNPSLDEETLKMASAMPIMPLALSEATEISHRLVSAWSLLEAVSTEKMERLLQLTIDATHGEVNIENLIKDLPWMLREGLVRICNDGVVERLPASQAAVGARIISSIVCALDTVPGLNQELVEET